MSPWLSYFTTVYTKTPLLLPSNISPSAPRPACNQTNAPGFIVEEVPHTVDDDVSQYYNYASRLSGVAEALQAVSEPIEQAPPKPVVKEPFETKASQDSHPPTPKPLTARDVASKVVSDGSEDLADRKLVGNGPAHDGHATAVPVVAAEVSFSAVPIAAPSTRVEAGSNATENMRVVSLPTTSIISS